MKVLVLLASITVFETLAVAQNTNPRPSGSGSTISALENRIKALERRVNNLEYQATKNDSVELDTAKLDGPYQRLNSNNGTFLVSLSNIERYLNGYKVTVSIGNTSSATFTGFELTMNWAKAEPPIEGDIDRWSTWYGSRKTKTETYTQSLLPGSWNKVEMVLLPASSDELGYLQVSMQTNAIILYRR